VTTLRRIAPIFAVSDVPEALTHYARLGFETREYEHGGYGFAVRDGVEIHLGGPAAGGAKGAPTSAYLFVEDADQLAQGWRAAGVDVHLPEDTEWGMREGVVIDPDGNTIRFGSPLPHR
jgi:uncharacterized glyoxalase superfamily protein PhnB